MSEQKSGTDDQRRDRVDDSDEPLPEPWFIRDLRHRRTEADEAPDRPVPGAAGEYPTMVPIGDLGRDSRGRDSRGRDGRSIPVTEPMTGPQVLPGAEPSHGVPPWLGGLIAVAVVVVALALYLTRVPRVGGADETATPTASTTMVPGVAPPTTAAPAGDPAAAAACANPATLDRLRALVAEAAGRGADGDPQALATAAERISLSVAGSSDTAGEAGAAACRGWLNFDRTTVPVSFRTLLTPDGQAHISIFQGAAPIVAALATGNGAAAEPRAPVEPAPEIAAAPVMVPSSPRPQLPDYGAAPQALTTDSNPSFDCSRASSRANRLVCGNDTLGALDRRLSSLFYDLADGADRDMRDELEDGRRAFLARKQQCDDESCLASVYRDQIDELRSYR